MLTFPNAKINLGLQVTAKRPDGFHELKSIFVPVPWCDMLEIVPAEEDAFTSTGIEIGGSRDQNLVLKAYELLKKEHGLPPISVHLHKAIPIGAGLGGGSADAAFMLKMLDETFSLNLNEDVLEEKARKLGSDCAFFIRNKMSFCHGKGDVFEDIDLDLKGLHLVMVWPDLHISTAEAYSGIAPRPSSFDLRQLKRKDLAKWKEVVINDFEPHLFKKYPLLAEVKKTLYAQGAAYACMSGSGSTLYGLFEEKPDIRGQYPPAFAVRQFRL